MFASFVGARGLRVPGQLVQAGVPFLHGHCYGHTTRGSSDTWWVVLRQGVCGCEFHVFGLLAKTQTYFQLPFHPLEIRLGF